MAVVRILANDGSSRAVQTFPLVGTDLVVGRAEDANICIDEPSLSRHHARIIWANGAWLVVEIASTNGVVVAGQRVGSHTLRDGDRFRLGQVELEFREVDPRQAQTVAMDGQGAAQMIQQVQAQRVAMAQQPAPTPAPAVAKSSGPSPAIIAALALGVVGVGGAGAYWFLVGRNASTNDGPAPPDPTPDTKTPVAKAEPPPTAGSETTTIVAKDETVRVQIDGGPKVTMFAGTFAAGTAVTIRRVEDTVATAVDGLRRVSPVWDFDAGGQQPQRDVTLSFVLPEKPTIGKDEQLVAVRSEGGKLIAYPTDYDPDTGRVRARIDHFSPIHIALGVIGVITIGGKLIYAQFGDDEYASTYDAHYTSAEGFRVYYMNSGTHAPAHETQKVNGHPRYVVRIGDELDESIRTFESNPAFSTFEKLGRDELPRAFVKNHGGSGDTGTFAVTSGSGWSIAFANGLSARKIAATVPHELFHVLQTEAIGFNDNAKEKLWSEMSAEWAAFVVNPAEAGPEIVATATSNPGFVDQGLNASLQQDEQYAAGDLATFLESQCPGLMKGLYSSSGALNPWASHDAWYTSTDRQMISACAGLSLRGALEEYFARFFFLGGVPTGRAGSCTIVKAITNEEPYKSATSGTRAAASAECDQVRAKGDTGRGPLVIAAQHPGPTGVELWVVEQTRDKQAGEMPSGGFGVVGLDLMSIADGSFLIEDFGGGASGARYNGAKLLITNPTDGAGGSVAYSTWVVHPPRGVAATYEKGRRRSEDKVFVKWDASRLPLASDTSGALKSYKILQKTASGTRELAVIDAPAVTTLVDASAITWTKRSAELVVRTVDRLKNESLDSLTVIVTQPDEPKPKPKVDPKPEDPKKPDPPKTDPVNPCTDNPRHPSCIE